jgi:plastocyanin
MSTTHGGAPATPRPPSRSSSTPADAAFAGGVVAGGMATPDEDGPFFPTTTNGITKNFALEIPSNYGFYCEVHALSGMTGAVFVE